MALEPLPMLRRGAAILLLLAGAASAQVQSPTLEATPASAQVENVWSRGVSQADRSAADALFQEGNALLKESITVSAAAKYREALKRWDHPNIHYNLALALMTLDQPVETHEHLREAMRHGPEPLQKERFEHARNYLALLDKQLARIEVRCDAPGAQVELDGRPLFTGPGRHEALVRAGRHTVVASKPGLVTNQTVRVLEGGSTTLIDLPLRSLDELTRTKRRWSPWLPWSIVGAGAALALGGGALHYDALQKVDWVDEQSRLRCPGAEGCAVEPSDLADARRRASTFQSVAVGAYSVGGAAVLAGVTLAFLNRAETYVVPYEELGGAPPPPPVEVTPTFGGHGSVGLQATIRF